jgi:cytochrome c biogenesis protein CcdA
VNVAGGTAIALGPGELLVRLAPHPGPTVTHALELGGGTLLLLAAVVLWRRRSRSLQSFGRRHHVERAAPLVGASIALAELPTAVPYFVVIAAIVRARLGVVPDVALLALYELLYLAPVLAIAALCAYGSRGQASWRVERLRRRLVRYETTVLAAILFLIALALLVLGVTGFVG